MALSQWESWHSDRPMPWHDKASSQRKLNARGAARRWESERWLDRPRRIGDDPEAW